MSPEKRAAWAGWALVLLFIGSAAGSFRQLLAHWDELRPVTSGDPAPAAAMRAIDADGRLGATVTLADLRGKVVVLDFWATWCGPCRQSMPAVRQLYMTYRDRGLMVISLNTEGGDMAQRARMVADRLAPGVPLYSDVDGSISDAYRATTIPYMVVIDRQGTVQLTHTGIRSVEHLIGEISEAVEPLLAE